MTETTTTEMHSSPSTQGTSAGRPYYDDVDNTTILMVGICSAIITVIIVAISQGLAYRWERSYKSDRLQIRTHQAIDDAIKAQKGILDSAEGEGRVTIDDAIRQVLKEYGQTGKPAGPVDAHQH